MNTGQTIHKNGYTNIPRHFVLFLRAPLRSMLSNFKHKCPAKNNKNAQSKIKANFHALNVYVSLKNVYEKRVAAKVGYSSSPTPEETFFAGFLKGFN